MEPSRGVVRDRRTRSGELQVSAQVGTHLNSGASARLPGETDGTVDSSPGLWHIRRTNGRKLPSVTVRAAEQRQCKTDEL